MNRFNCCIFDGETNFRSAKFEGSAHFNEANFRDEASFERASFSEDSFFAAQNFSRKLISTGPYLIDMQILEIQFFILSRHSLQGNSSETQILMGAYSLKQFLQKPSSEITLDLKIQK